MIHPITGQPTHFAFGDNPVNRTGWLNTTRGDMRTSFSFAPFSISSGQSVPQTWVIDIQQGLSLQYVFVYYHIT